MTDSADRNLSRLAAESASATPLFRGPLGHHINNSLTVVIADLQFALQHTHDDEARAALDEALEEARRIATIVVTVKGDGKKTEPISPAPKLPAMVMVEVEALLIANYGDRASLHVARTERNAWCAWITGGTGVAASAVGTSIEAAVVALLWPKEA